jgi:hypothetical protein
MNDYRFIYRDGYKLYENVMSFPDDKMALKEAKAQYNALQHLFRVVRRVPESIIWRDA